MDKKNLPRTSSHGRKLHAAGLARPTRPAPLLHKRQLSYNNSNNASSSSLHGSASSAKPTLGASKKSGTEVVSYFDDDEETGMASFLQFCATCEKQIITPGSSILYCSAACRRRDVSRTSPIEAIHSPSVLPPASSYFDVPPADIVPQRSPTVLRPLSFASSSDFSSASASTSPTTSGPDQHDFRDGESEASRYLSQFHSHSYSADLPHRPRRPRPNRASTATTTTDYSTTIPSLVNTPSSSLGSSTAATSPTSFHFSHRPLPPRHDPLTTSFPSKKSVDLVTPLYYPPPRSPAEREGSMTSSVDTIIPAGRSQPAPPSASADFAKATAGKHQRRSDPGAGSLKQLFRR